MDTPKCRQHFDPQLRCMYGRKRNVCRITETDSAIGTTLIKVFEAPLILCLTFPSQKLSWGLGEPSYHQRSAQNLKRTSALMETPPAVIGVCATQKMSLYPGLPLTTALQSPSKESKYSTDKTAVGLELEMLTSAFRNPQFHILPSGFLLAAASSVNFADLPLMGNR